MNKKDTKSDFLNEPMVDPKDLKFYTLYEYLGKAAGKELGAEVWNKAITGNIPIINKEISNRKYTGKVNAYPIYFLLDYFSYNKLDS